MVERDKQSFETVWINSFFQHYGGEVRYSQADLRRWRVNWLDLLEVGRYGAVIGGNKRDAAGAWWTVEGYSESAGLLHVTVIAVTEVHFVEVIDVARVGRIENEDGNAA